MNNNFMKAMVFVKKWEGVFSDDSFDPGGKTKYGISDAGDGTIDGLVDIDRDGKGDVKVEELTLEQAIQCYYNSYYVPRGCNDMPLVWAVPVFDAAVNCGVGRAKKWFKKESEDTRAYNAIRREFYYDLVLKNKKLKKYINGWLNRIVDLNKYVDILKNEV